MENQRRRFEKEKEDAFEYGGFSFAKEALNLIDNLDRSKHVLESDDSLKETESLKKSLEHLDIIKKDYSNVPYFDHNRAVLSAPVRHIFMMSTIAVSYTHLTLPTKA